MSLASVSIIVPVYGSEQSLPELYRRLVSVLEGESYLFEILFVEDCSKDDSWQIIQEIAASDSRVRGFSLSRNYGQHNALLCGVRAAKNALIVTLDDDLQNPPEEIPKLLAKLQEGYDVVYGTRENEQHSLFRNAASQVTKYVLQEAMGAETARRVSAFRVFRKEVCEGFTNYSSPMVNLDVLLTWSTTRFGAIPVQHLKRQIGVSGYTLRKLLTHSMNMITGFSTRPLQLASFLGFTFALFGFFILSYVLVHYVMHGSRMPGFPFLASIIAIFSGVQLLALGIIGEYLARMHFRTMDRPPYLVRRQVG